MRYNSVVMHVDGACDGNPGPSGAGAVAYDENGDVIFTFSEPIGICTSNEAEYKSLISSLEYLLSHHQVDNLRIRSDSTLMVKQMRGQWRAKEPRLEALRDIAKDTLESVPLVDFEVVSRRYNKQADRLSKKALEKKEESSGGSAFITFDMVRKHCLNRCPVRQFDHLSCHRKNCPLLLFAYDLFDLHTSNSSTSTAAEAVSE